MHAQNLAVILHGCLVHQKAIRLELEHWRVSRLPLVANGRSEVQAVCDDIVLFAHELLKNLLAEVIWR